MKKVTTIENIDKIDQKAQEQHKVLMLKIAAFLNLAIINRNIFHIFL